jgi:hypothetical protein
VSRDVVHLASTRRRTECTQHRKAPLAEYRSCDLADDAVDPFNVAGIVPYGVVGDIEVGFFAERVAFEEERPRPCRVRFAGANDVAEDRAEKIPHLAPGLPRGTTERPGVLSTEHRPIRVVVEHDEVGAPEQDDLRLRGEQEADGMAQDGRPLIDRAERGVRPIVRPDSGRHFAGVGQEPLHVYLRVERPPTVRNVAVE